MHWNVRFANMQPVHQEKHVQIEHIAFIFQKAGVLATEKGVFRAICPSTQCCSLGLLYELQFLGVFSACLKIRWIYNTRILHTGTYCILLYYI